MNEKSLKSMDIKTWIKELKKDPKFKFGFFVILFMSIIKSLIALHLSCIKYYTPKDIPKKSIPKGIKKYFNVCK